MLREKREASERKADLTIYEIWHSGMEQVVLDDRMHRIFTCLGQTRSWQKLLSEWGWKAVVGGGEEFRTGIARHLDARSREHATALEVGGAEVKWTEGFEMQGLGMHTWS